MYEKLLDDRIRQLKGWLRPEGVNEILADTFSELFAYNRERFDELARNIAAEKNVFPESPVIVTAVSERDNYHRQKSFFPVREGCGDRPGHIAVIFMESDYFAIKQCMGREYPCTVHTKTRTIQTLARLRYCERYLSTAADLYGAFIANELPWATLNAVYFYKFLDLYSEEIGAEEILGFEADFGEYSKDISFEKELLWNIERMSVPVKCAAVPAGNAVQFEHTVSNLPAGEYLISPFGGRFTYFWRDGVLFIRTYSEEFRLTEIKLLRVHSESRQNSGRLHHPARSNQKEALFSAALAKSQRRFVPSAGEAARIVHSLRQETGIELIDIKLLSHTGDKAEHYEMLDFNPFIHMNSFTAGGRLLLFAFKTDAAEEVKWEMMFFVLSELQMYFYEFRCVGTLL